VDFLFEDLLHFKCEKWVPIWAPRRCGWGVTVKIFANPTVTAAHVMFGDRVHGYPQGGGHHAKLLRLALRIKSNTLFKPEIRESQGDNGKVVALEIIDREGAKTIVAFKS